MTLERQAREWLIRLDGDEPLTGPEVASLREWMARSPAHKAELARLCRFWNHANILTELAIPLRPQDTAPRSRIRPVLGVALAASSVIACTLLGYWWLQRGPEVTDHRYATAVGEQKTLVLKDGSTIQLNTDTQIQVTYTHQLRRVRLWRGEALFSATRDPNRPFEVYANDNVVRAVGTAFAVHLEGNNVDVTVTDGVVDVAETDNAPTVPSVVKSKPTQRHRAPSSLGLLKAGQATIVGAGSQHLQVQQLAEPELQRRIAWHEGFLVFAGEPLSEVVEQLNRYSPVSLEIADPKLASVAIGGRFRIGDLEAILDVLDSNFGIQARQVDGRNIRLESR